MDLVFFPPVLGDMEQVSSCELFLVLLCVFVFFGFLCVFSSLFFSWFFPGWLGLVSQAEVPSFPDTTQRSRHASKWPVRFRSDRSGASVSSQGLRHVTHW